MSTTKEKQSVAQHQEQGTQSHLPMPPVNSGGQMVHGRPTISKDYKPSSPPSSPPMSASEKDPTTWNGPADPENPFNWPSSKKWRVTILACLITFLSGISGTALAPTAPLLTTTFHLPPDATAAIPPTYLPLLSWTLSAAIIPLILLPLMETYGTRLPYLACLATLALSLLPQALCPRTAYALLIAIRTLTGGAAGVLQNVTGGIVGDVWAGPRARSTPVALYIWALVAGLMVGPVVGGALSSALDSWRWVCWVQLAVYAAACPLTYFLLPETRGSAILQSRSSSSSSSSSSSPSSSPTTTKTTLLKEAIGRPLRMLTTEPLVACATLWSAFCFGNALLFTQSIPRVYGALYGWEPWRCGVVQGALVAGVTVGLALAPLQNAWYYRTATTSTTSSRGNDDDDEEAEGAGAREEETENEEGFSPEGRLYLSVPASFVGLAGGLLVYAWTAWPGLHWMAPTVGLFLVGVGIFTVVTAASNYVEDSYSLYAASALAGVACGENLMGAFLPLAEQALYTNLGLRWASSLLAFVAVGLSFAPVVLLWKGRAIRARSPFIRQAMYETHS